MGLKTWNRAVLFTVLVLSAASASSEEVMTHEQWVSPGGPAVAAGNWPVVVQPQTHFAFSLPANLVSIETARIVVIGRSAGSNAFEVGLSIAADGEDNNGFSTSSQFMAHLDRDEIEEIEISSLFPSVADLTPGADYAGITVARTRAGGPPAGVVGLRMRYVTQDRDLDPDNELNTSLTFDGTNLQVTDAGGTLSADLSGLGGGDADWLAVGTSTPPASIADHIYTLGRVGVGTVTPDTALDVSGKATIRGDLNMSGGDTFIINQGDLTKGWIRFNPSGLSLDGKIAPIRFDSDIRFLSNRGIQNQAGARALQLYQGMAYGIANPVRIYESLAFGTLHIAPGDPQITAEDTFELRFDADNDGSSGSFLISRGDNGAPQGQHQDLFVLQYDGEVGIGTTQPSEMLDVNGNARIRSVGSGAHFADLGMTTDGTLTTDTSDARLKTDIAPLQGTLSGVLQLRGVSFRWKNADDVHREDIGLIAQEVEGVFPQVVFTNGVDGYKGINYSRLPAVLVEAIKEQQAIIEAQNEKIRALERTMSQLMAALTNRERGSRPTMDSLERDPALVKPAAATAP